MSKSVPVLPPRYEVLAPLGKGGGGEVWSVRDRISGNVLALKALSEGADEAEVMALVREATALSGVEGLGVPQVLRFGRLPNSERAYMVRELVEGQSLMELLEKRGDAMAAVRAVAQTAGQLAQLHRALLLHGDIKPANIIVSSEGRASLVDLGLAAVWREGGARPEGLTPRYAAPELMTGAPLTVRGEVYSLGATLAEVLEHLGSELADEANKALQAVVERATRRVPEERHPSVDELASAVRAAAKLPAPEAGLRSAAWPVVGLDGPSGELLTQIRGLRKAGGIVITGPRLSGRSTLLRRIAWSLGIEGQAVAWLEASAKDRADEALDVELGAHPEPSKLVVLVDDADQLDAKVLRRLDALRKDGARLVMVTGLEDAGRLPGHTFQVFATPPLDETLAGDLVRRAIPSLSDAVVTHVVALCRRWPGKLRALVALLERAPVVAPEDVDSILDQSEEVASGFRTTPPPAPDAVDLPSKIRRLLDRGHFEEAANMLVGLEADESPEIAIARARLFTNRGNTERSLEELRAVRDAVDASDDASLRGEWFLHSARAYLRAGDYAQAEEDARQVSPCFEPSGPSGAGADSIVAEALAVCGLASSFVSKHEEAREVLDRAVGLARKLGEPRILSVALGSLAFALQRDDRLTDAKSAYEEGLAAAEQAGDAGSVATVRLNLAGIAKTQGDIAGSLSHLEAAVDMGRRSGRIATLRQALLNLANLDLYLGRIARAKSSIDQLAEERRDLPPQLSAQLLALEAECAARTGDLHAAERLCRECADAYDAVGRPVDAAEAHLERVLFVARRPDADADALARDLQRVDESLAGAGAHRALRALARGRVAGLLGDDARAQAALEEAIATGRESGQRDIVWKAMEMRSRLLLKAEQTMAAKRDREAALSILEDIATHLPRDLREVYWNDPRRRAIRSAPLYDLPSATTMSAMPVVSTPGQDRLARVLEINREIAGTHDLPHLLERVTDHAIALLSAERGFIILKSRKPRDNANPDASDALSIHASRDQSGDDPHARFSQSIADKVISAGEPIVTTSALSDQRMADYVSVHQLMLQSVACVPIRSRTAGIIGALYLETRLQPGVNFAQELPTLQSLSDQVAIAIETARLVSENERRTEELRKANEELEAARQKLEELLGHRTAQLAATRRDLRSARDVIRGHFGYKGLIGRSAAMRRVYALIDRVKDTDVPILITGESGTGKEIIARAIHGAGPRAKKAFVGINCGAIPENLLESELFGHVRGAFTGADRDRRGLFREASEGSVLLDEIGEMPQKMQAGLLRVLQEKVVRPVGGAKEEAVDARVIAATHRDLESMVREGSFREDLYYRLNVIMVRVPPLRERLDDLPVLIDHFLGIFAARYGRDRRSVSRAALKRLTAYDWPGNVRQLENILLNAWVLSDQPELEPEDFELPDSIQRPPRVVTAEAPPAAMTDASGTDLDNHRANEKDRIIQALSSCNWNRVKAAEIVGLPRRTFYRRLKEYGIQ